MALHPTQKGVLMEDTKNTFFGYKSDETTAMQIKNNMMVMLHIQVIWFGCFVTSYLCSSLFLGHYSHEDLAGHFLDFLKIFNFSTELLLNIGLDGPNKTFVPKNKVISHWYWFISNPYCRWSVSVSMSIKLVCYLDEAAVELHCFFKWSAACCEDCKRLEYITEIIVHFMKEHMESW